MPSVNSNGSEFVTGKSAIARRLCAVVACGALIASTAAASSAAVPDFTGVWLLEKAPIRLQPSDGAPLPLTPEATITYAKHQEMLSRRDYGFDLTRDRCAAPGALRMMTLAGPVEIFQRPHQLTMLFEWNHLYRMVNLRPEAKSAPYPLAIGISNGRWDGDTLVVVTTDMTDNTLLDSAGLPHSDQLRLEERFRLLPDGRLEDLIRIHDPKTFLRDWSVRLTFRKTGAKGVDEDVCLDRLAAGKQAVAEVR